MNSTHSIHRASRKDAPELGPLFNAYRVFYELAPDPEGAFVFVSERLSQDDSIIFLARDKEGHGLGFAQLYPSFSSLRMARTWILNDLFVSEPFREHGIGKQLVLKCVEFAKSTSSPSIILETGQDNFPAQRLYETLGFEKDEYYYHYELILED